MRRIILLVLCFFVFGQTEVLAFSNEKEMIKDLNMLEVKIFDKTYKKDNITERLERLEISVYGAIQNGNEYIRVKKIKRDVTNISSGGSGLGNNNRIFGFSDNNVRNYHWSVGNVRPYNNVYYNMNGYSHRLPDYHGHWHSHRLPPPKYPDSYSSNAPMGFGSGSKSCSMGTCIKILDD